MEEQRSPNPGSSPQPPAEESSETAPPQTASTRTAGRIFTRHVAAELAAWLGTLMSAALYATIVITFVFQVARVEGHSMAPTLENQDRLVINKVIYRFEPPRIGDVVMMYYPPDPSKTLVKRVIAEQGDRVRIVDGKIYRNGDLMDDSFISSTFRGHDDWGPQVIPEGYYFVLGDHRTDSSDSRLWGYVPKNYIAGRVQVRWWPPNRACVFSHRGWAFGGGTNASEPNPVRP